MKKLNRKTKPKSLAHKLGAVSQCTICGLLGRDHVPAAGSLNADLMIVGQSPGEQEVKYHRPFSGPCGEMLDYMLDEAELSRETVYITNALKCRPPGNRQAIGGELANCRQKWLANEIEVVDPKMILVLGQDAFEAVMPPKYRDQWGHMVEIRSAKRLYLASYHPGYYIRQGAAGLDKFVSVGKKVRELLEELEQEL